MSDDADKRRPITDAQWLAARAVSEGAPSTRVRVAALLGCDVSAVYERAAKEGWTPVDYRRPAVKAAQVHLMSAAFGNVEAGAETEATEGFDPDWADDDGQATRRGLARRNAGSGGEAGQDAPPGEDDSDDPFEMLSRGAKFLSRRLTRLMRRAEAGGHISKQELENLMAIMRMMERWETLAKERARQEEAKSDEDVAETLRIINAKIIELAQEEALRLVAADARRKKLRKGKSRVARRRAARAVPPVEA